MLLNKNDSGRKKTNSNASEPPQNRPQGLLKTHLTQLKGSINRCSLPQCIVIIVVLFVSRFYAMIFCTALSLSGHSGDISVFTLVIITMDIKNPDIKPGFLVLAW